jgi:non-ribosomal peptide synthetase component F
MIRRLTTACVLLAASVFLMLLARDVWHWQRAMADADARASVGTVSPAAWNAHATLPHDLALRLLGLNDDLSYRGTATRAAELAANEVTSKTFKERAVIETALQRIGADTSDPRRASLAADLLGVLRYTDPPSPDQVESAYEGDQSGRTTQQTPEQKALEQFLLAVRLDPNNDNAQRNLELMLRQPAPPEHKSVPHAGGGDRAGRKGSGAQDPGHGY